MILFLTSLIGFASMPRRLRPRRARLAAPLSLSIGAGLVGLCGYLVGVSAGSRWVAPLFLVAGVSCLSRARELLRVLRGAARELVLLARSSPVATLLLALPLLAALPHLLLPVVDSDGLRYHLAYPKLYLLEGKVSQYPWDVTGAYPESAEMLYLIGLSVSGETAKFLHAGFFLAALATLALLVHRGRRTRVAAVLAPFLFAATPLALVPAPAAFVDGVAMLHLAAAALALAGGAHPLLAGCAMGGAFATKLTSAPALVGLAVAGLARARGRRAGTLLALAIPALIAYAPYAVRNVVETGDPIFPIGHGLLRKPIPGLPASAEKLVSQMHSEVPGPLGIAWGARDAQAANVQADEVAGWHHALGLFAIVLAARRRETRIFLAFVFPYLLLALLFRPATRLLMPLFFGLAAYEALALARLPRRVAPLLAAALACPALVLAATVLLTSFDPFAYLSGRQRRDAYLARQVPGYAAAAFVNARPAGGKVMALDFPAPFYFTRPWIAEGTINVPPLAAWVQEGASGAAMIARLRDLGVRYLVVTPGYGGGRSASLLPLARDHVEAAAVLELRRALRPLARVDGVDVFEVP